MKKAALLSVISAALLGLAACNNGSLLQQNNNVPPGFLFAQVAFEPLQDLSTAFAGGKDRTGNVEDVYQIQLSEATLILGNAAPSTEAPAAAPEALSIIDGSKSHGTESHGTGSETPSPSTSETNHTEPTSCDYDDSFSDYQYLNLLEEATFPCVTIAENDYQSFGLAFHPATSDVTVLDLPEGRTSSIRLVGTASWNGVTYAFRVEGASTTAITVVSPFSLSSDTHHITLHVDVKSWFHGVDFSQLDTVDGVVVFDETTNVHRYEHMVNDHIPESITIATEE